MEQKTGANESQEEGLDGKPVHFLVIAPLSENVSEAESAVIQENARKTAAGESSFGGNAEQVFIKPAKGTLNCRKARSQLL